MGDQAKINLMVNNRKFALRFEDAVAVIGTLKERGCTEAARVVTGTLTEAVRDLYLEVKRVRGITTDGSAQAREETEEERLRLTEELIEALGERYGRGSKPAARPGEFDFREFVSQNGDVALFCFRADTGEGWLLKDNLWKKFVEPDELPRGHYEFIVAGLRSYRVFRVNRVTGATWNLHVEQWVHVEEPK